MTTRGKEKMNLQERKLMFVDEVSLRCTSVGMFIRYIRHGAQYRYPY